jgi:hypothetical protein
VNVAESPGCTALTEAGLAGPAVHPPGRFSDAVRSVAFAASAGTVTVALAVNACPDWAVSGTWRPTAVPGGLGMAYFCGS